MFRRQIPHHVGCVKNHFPAPSSHASALSLRLRKDNMSTTKQFPEPYQLKLRGISWRVYVALTENERLSLDVLRKTAYGKEVGQRDRDNIYMVLRRLDRRIMGAGLAVVSTQTYRMSDAVGSRVTMYSLVEV
jgi:hypothetical protein